MSTSPKPIKLVIMIATAAIMVAIALAIVLNFQGSTGVADEEEAARPDIDVLVPETVMHRGETKVIPLEVRITSKEPLDARIWMFSTESPNSAERETMSNSADLEEQFQALRQRGFSGDSPAR